MRMLRLLALIASVLPVVLLAAPAALPTPESVIGFRPGTDFKLFNYEQAIAYFKKLDAASDALTLVEAGRTSQGRAFYFALISNPKNLSQLDRYREISRRLAHPAGLTEAQARDLARAGKPFVHIDGGLHATEVAGPQMMPQLAYDLLSRSNEPEIRDVLDDVIFMLWPTINPDGQTMVADWYMSHLGTPNESAQLPVLYQEYVGHDNNRDAYMLNMIESRVMEHTWRQWEPSIVYVQHQSPPFPYRIWLPPFAEPIATHAPPLISQEINMIGMAIAKGLDERGQSGATHMGTGYDAWYPGYIDYLPIFKNIPAFWTETANTGGGLAAPRQYAPESIPANLRVPKALYPSPWLGGWWRLRDAVEYDETAALSVLQFAAKYKESLLYDRYLAGRTQIANGRQRAPYAYLIPQDQRDPVAAVEMLRRLAFSGVRVSQLTAPVAIGGATYAAGTWVVPADQEFAALAREVLDVQKYPDVRESPTGPLDQPYDAAGWTLPLQMGVKTIAVDAPLDDDVRSKMRLLGPAPDPRVKPVPYNLNARADAAPFDSVPGVGFDTDPAAAAIVPPAGTLSGAGPALAVNPAENNAFRAINRALKAGLDVQFVPGASPSAARYVISIGGGDRDDLVKSLALQADRSPQPSAPMKRPRVALFNAPTSMDEGWTRWVLEQYGFDFNRLPATEIEAGGLRAKYDVILITDEAAGVLSGGRGAGGGRGGPAPAPNPSNEARVKAIDEFVRAGGTLVCFNRSSSFAIDQLHLPVRNAAAGVSRQQLFASGSLLNVTTSPAHRVMAGMPEQAAVFFDGSPVFETLDGFKGTVLARYQADGSPLASGYLLGEKYLQGKAAALDVDLGEGHVVLLGFRPQWRGQPFGTFRVIFNSLLYVR
jgi:hypothetical protein